MADPAVEADLFCAKLLGYTHRNGKDLTVQVLRSFVDHLPLVTHLKTAVHIVANISFYLTVRAQGGKTPQVSKYPSLTLSRADKWSNGLYPKRND